MQKEGIDLKKILDQVITLSRDVGSYIRKESVKVSSGDIKEKELNSLVSYVDITAERMLTEKLIHLIPDCGFITEEKTKEQSTKAYTWIIDPLDGTTNYLFSIPHYCISIALQYNNRTVLGLVYDCAKEECFHAIDGQGAFLDAQKLQIQINDKLAQSIFVTGFPYKNNYETKAYLEIIEHWLQSSRGVRRLGSAALDLCYVASGRVSCYYESFLNIWDLAAGALIAKESGAVVSDFSGSSSFLEKGEIIACNPGIYEEVTVKIQEKLS